MIKIARQILLLLITLVLVSCSATSPTSSVPGATATKGTFEQGYPLQNGPGATDSYPAPLSPTQDFVSSFPETVTIPKPKDGVGVVTGRLVESGNREPYLASTLILGTMVFANEPNAAPPLLRYSEVTDPKATQDRSGKFYFEDIAPGTYGIVIWTPGSHSLVNDGQGNTVQVNVEAGKVTDLGDVFVP